MRALRAFESDEPILTLCLPWAGIQEEEAVAIGAENGGNDGVWWEQGKRARPTLTFVPRSFAASCLRLHICLCDMLSETHTQAVIVVFAAGWNRLGRVTRDTK